MRKETKIQITAWFLFMVILFAGFYLTSCSLFKEKEETDYRPDMTPATGDSNDVLTTKKDMFTEQLENELAEKNAELAEATKREKQNFYRRYEIMFIFGIVGGILAAILLKSKVIGLAAVLSCSAGITAIELIQIEWPVWLQITGSIAALAATGYGVYAVIIHDIAFGKNVKGNENFKAATVPAVVAVFKEKQREVQGKGSATEKLVAKYQDIIKKENALMSKCVKA